MATDFEGSLPVQTARDDEFKIILVDGDSGSDATQKLEINANSAAKTYVTSHDNNNLFIDSDGSIKANVTIDSASQDLICSYEESEDVAKNAEVEHDYIITDTKTFIGCSVLVGARGAVKVTLGSFDGTDFTKLASWYQLPASNETKSFKNIKYLGDGTKAIRIKVKNLDQTTDIMTTLQGEEE